MYSAPSGEGLLYWIIIGGSALLKPRNHFLGYPQDCAVPSALREIDGLRYVFPFHEILGSKCPIILRCGVVVEVDQKPVANLDRRRSLDPTDADRGRHVRVRPFRLGTPSDPQVFLDRSLGLVLDDQAELSPALRMVASITLNPPSKNSLVGVKVLKSRVVVA